MPPVSVKYIINKYIFLFDLGSCTFFMFLQVKFCPFSFFQERGKEENHSLLCLIFLFYLSCVFPCHVLFLSIFHVESFCLIFSVFSFSFPLYFPLLSLFPLPPYLVEYLLSSTSTLCSLSLPPSLLCTQLLRFNRSYW